MRVRGFARYWQLLLTPLLGLPGAAADAPKNRSCLLNASYAPSERRNVTLGGVSQPFRVANLHWDSALILQWMFRIVTEEVLGINTVAVGRYNSGKLALADIFSCVDPATKAVPPTYVGPHVMIGAWVDDVFGTTIEETRRFRPEAVPIGLGPMGYTAYDGVFVQGESYEPAMEQRHLPLDFYGSYSHPAFDPRQFFDSPWSIDLEQLKPCNTTLFADSAAAATYLRIFNDSDGVTVTHGPLGDTYSARCEVSGKWWLAPACRLDRSRCMALISAGDGYDVDSLMQRVTAWQMPVAMAVVRDWDTYEELRRRHRILFYWWVPDSTFVGQTQRKLIWPVHDSLEYSQGFRRSEPNPVSVEKFACANLENRSHTGFSEPLSVLRSMRFKQFEIVDLIKAAAKRQGDPEALEKAACEWLNHNPDRYASWIPLSTACAPQQGLVNRSGGFAAAREDAAACDWCTPGRMSSPLRDEEGATHTCELCGAGRFQKSLGATSCERCEEGTFSAARGMHSCQRCRFGAYAAESGQSACTGCPTGMITTFLGAASKDACICPAGTYRDGRQRNACLPCKEGMTCPEGSDVLGYQTEHAARYTVVPILEAGFWASSEEPLSVFRCQDDVRCPGGRVPGSPCAENFEQQRCGVCKAGYAQSRSTCVPCDSQTSQVLVFPILPVVFFVAAICCIYRLDGAPYAMWGSWKKGVAASFFIVLNYYHVVSIIRALNVIPKTSVSETLQSVSVFSDVLSAFRPQCGILNGFLIELVVKSHAPALIFLVYVAVFLISWILGRGCPAIRMDPNRLLNGYLSIVFTFFTVVTDMALIVFKCSSNPNGVYTLLKDRSITCYEEEWMDMLAVGVTAVALWCLGFSALLLYAVCAASRHFHTAGFQTRWTFLFVRYRPDVHWWAMIIVAKGFLLNVGSLFITSGVGQIYWILGVLLLYTILLLTFRPWRHILNHYVDGYAHLSLFLTCAVVVWFSHGLPLNIDQQDMLGEYLLKANIASAVVPFVLAVARMWWREFSSKARHDKDTDTELIIRAIDILAKCGCSNRLKFLQRLTEHDFALMNEMKDMILTELGNKKVRAGYSSRQLTRLSIMRVCSESRMASLRSQADVQARLSRGDATDSIDATDLIDLAGVKQIVL